MAEYLIQEETLIGIADEVRTLSGETKNLTTTEIKSNISTANNTINTQANLIAQIQTALEGKAAGGTGGGVETCTVEIAASVKPIVVIYVSSLDGNYTYWRLDGPGDYPQPFTCVCGSIIYLSTSYINSLSYSNATHIDGNAIIITAPAGGTARIYK